VRALRGLHTGPAGLGRTNPAAALAPAGAAGLAQGPRARRAALGLAAARGAHTTLPRGPPPAAAGAAGGPARPRGAGADVAVEDDDTAVARHAAAAGEDARIRVVGHPSATLWSAAAAAGVDVLAGPVLASGRRELLTVLREQAISRTAHRYGTLTD
jgi:RHH-type transcriptional regulator, proline utilization regulon repressor / proline dehydrogenase / delta 1-pyrroline-5-carboxylate dehydrogenase